MERVRERMARACIAAGRSPAEVRLLAVTKSVEPAHAAELIALGQVDLGENRVDELERKVEALGADASRARWHVIGHLQRNKARRAARHAWSVQSVDSVRLLDALSRLAGELVRELRVYLEVRAVEAGERSGFAAGELGPAAEHAASLPHLRLVGLMAMAAPDERARPGDLASQSGARATFAAVRELAQRLPRGAFDGGRVELSMGMSSDLEAAIAEGAHVVRVGSALFEDPPRERAA